MSRFDTASTQQAPGNTLQRPHGARGLRALLAASLLTLALAPGSAGAEVSFEAKNGWALSFDGFVNVFAVNEMGSQAPAGAAEDPFMSSGDTNSFRLRTGLLPGLFAVNVKAPRLEGLDMKARVGLYMQAQNGNTRNAFGSQIDLRELFFTADGVFGQVLLGRAINLYQGRNILTDMTLFGVGAQGPASAGGTTLGRIGYGYLYAQFGAQARYTTPSLHGLKLAVAAVDPSQIAGAGVAATQTGVPGFEAELSYQARLGATDVQAWVSGLQQRARVPGGDHKTALGWAAGVGTSVVGLDVLASGFGGRGLGSFLLLDTDSLDATGEERRSVGVLVQGAYTLFGTTKLGLSYGQNTLDETAAEAAARTGGGDSELETRRSWTAGVYHDINKHLKVVGEYTRATSRWFGGQRQAVDAVAVGGFFLW